MDGEHSTAEERARYEQQQLKARGMLLLTGGLTGEADAFLLGIGAVALTIALYPVIGGWALVAFSVVLIGAIVVRRRLRRRTAA